MGDQITIDSSGCPTLNFNGFVDTFAPIDSGAYPTPAFLRDEQIAAEERTILQPPDNLPHPKFASVRTTTDPSTLALTTKLPIDKGTYNVSTGQATLSSSNPNDWKDTFTRLMPSNFTGFMRKVVQSTLGSAGWSVLAPSNKPGGGTNPAVCPVDWHFGNSWGCIYNPDKSKYYFIQITTDGVYYVPGSYCMQASIKGGSKDAIILQSLNTKKAVKLCDIPPGLGGSVSPLIGWSFAYTNAEAAIVYYSSTSLPNMGSFVQSYVTTSLLQLLFYFDPDKGNPISAHLTISTPQVFYLQQKMTLVDNPGYFQVPMIGDDGNLQNITFDFGSDFYGSQPPMGYSVSNSPVYVYYNLSGLQVYGWTWNSTPSTTTTQTMPASRVVLNWDALHSMTVSQTDQSALIDQGWVGTKIEGGKIDWGFSVNGARDYVSVGAHTDSYTEYDLGITGSKNEDAFSHMQVVHWETVSTPLPLQPPIDPTLPEFTGFTQGAFYGASVSTTNIFTVTIKNVSGGGISAVSSLVLSTTDRECAVIYSIQSSDVKTTDFSLQYGYAQIYLASDTMNYPASIDDGGAGTISIWDEQIQYGYGSWYRSDGSYNYPYPSYPNTACGATTGSITGHDDYLMRYSDTGAPCSRCISLSVGASYAVANNVTYSIESTPDLSYLCDPKVQTQLTTNYGGEVFYYDYSGTTTDPEASQSKCTLYYGDHSFATPATTDMMKVHPISGEMAFWFEAAAYGSGYAMLESTTTGAQQVHFDGTMYPISHALSGWVGVV